MRRPTPARVLAGAHAAYLVGTGLWPVVHRESFERVTGRKRDFWLVRLVGGLAAANGAALGVAVVRGRPSPETRALALGSALTFGLADAHAARSYSRLYLGDALVQLVAVPAWLRPWERFPGAEAAEEVWAKPTLDDDALKAKVEDHVRSLDGGIDVEVEQGVVRLHGSVERQELVTELLARIERIPEIRGIDPHVAVSEPA